MSDSTKRPRGRPKVPADQRRGNTPVRSLRMDDDRWAKLLRLGRSWLEQEIDEAPEPSPGQQ